jgi:hypothetical protein
MSPIESLPDVPDNDGILPLTEYRAVSLSALFALGLGLLSAVSVFSPLLVIIPLAAIIVGCYALWKVQTDHLAGRWMAVASLVLAPLFLGWGISREIARKEFFCTHAREFADDWLSILNKNEPYFAHQLWVDKKRRLDTQLNFEVAYQRDETATEQFRLFMGSSPTKEIMAAAPNVKFKFEQFLRHRHFDDLTDVVTLQYTYETPGASPMRFWLNVRRTFSIYTGRPDWQITDIALRPPRGT